VPENESRIFAELLGCDATRVRQLAASASRKLAELGVDADALLGAF